MPEALCTLCKKTVFTSQDKFARHHEVLEESSDRCEGSGKTVSEVEKMERERTKVEA